MKRSFLALSSLLLLLMSLKVQASVLTDIEGDPHQTAIEYLYEKKVVSGYPDGRFQPLRTLNRAELSKFLAEGKGITPTLEEGYQFCFPDVAQEWFAPYVCYAKAQGWVAGYPDGRFQPAKKVIKVEAIKMLVNSQGYSVESSVKEHLFEDADNSQWYAPFLKAAKDRGLLEETTVYGVLEEMTRGMISENLYRAMILIEEGLSHFSDYLSQPTLEPEPIPESTPVANQICISDTYNCSDFSSHSEAQSTFDQCWTAVGKDIHGLDSDDDGIACESL